MIPELYKLHNLKTHAVSDRPQNENSGVDVNVNVY